MTDVVSVAGGDERSHSVRNALEAAGDGDVILVHDAARPLLTAELVGRCLAALDEGESWDAAIAAAPVTDTIKRAPAGIAVTETLRREELWAVQTPQVFRRAALERALGGRPRSSRPPPTTRCSSSATAGACGSSRRRPRT